MASTFFLSTSTALTPNPLAAKQAASGAPSFPSPITEIVFSMILPSEQMPAISSSPHLTNLQFREKRSYLIIGGQSGPGISYNARSRNFLPVYQKNRTFGTCCIAELIPKSLSISDPPLPALSSARAMASQRSLNLSACCKLSESACSRKPPINESTVYSCACRKKRTHSSKSLAYRHAASTCPPAFSHKLRRQNVDAC